MERSRVVSFRDIIDQQQVGLFAPKMVDCINNAFGHQMHPRGIDAAIKGQFITSVVSRESNEVIGFSTVQSKKAIEFKVEGLQEDDDGFYFGASVISERFQGRGIYRVLNWSRIAFVVKEEGKFIATHTQNPKVETGISHTLNMFVSAEQLQGYSLKRIYNQGFYKRRLTKNNIDLLPNSIYYELDVDHGDCFTLIYALQY